MDNFYSVHIQERERWEESAASVYSTSYGVGLLLTGMVKYSVASLRLSVCFSFVLFSL